MNTRQNTPTARAYSFQTMVEAMKNGLQIPPEMLVEASDWPFKEELIEKMKAAQQPMAPGAIPGQPAGGAPMPIIPA